MVKSPEPEVEDSGEETPLEDNLFYDDVNANPFSDTESENEFDILNPPVRSGGDGNGGDVGGDDSDCHDDGGDGNGGDVGGDDGDCHDDGGDGNGDDVGGDDSDCHDDGGDGNGDDVGGDVGDCHDGGGDGNGGDA